MGKSEFNRSGAVMIAAVMVLALLAANAQAATYFSIRPDKEVCTTIVFGQNGRGEYVLTAQEPAGDQWADNHFTSFVAGPENIIMVPICFSARGRALGDNTNVVVDVSTPSGNVTHYYGVCVAAHDDVDVVPGAATGNACDRMAGHTDLFSAGLDQPEKYASPGDAVTFTLVLDSTLPLTLDIAKGSEMQMVASATSIAAGASQEQVQLQLTAPGTAGDYDFIVVVMAQGCDLSDCSRSVRGVIHVADAQGTPQAGFYAWLSPETKSVMGQQSTMFVLRFTNYGNGQQLTATVSPDAGLGTDFSPYSVFLAKGQSRSISFTVRPETADQATYKVLAVVTGDDGTKREAQAWLTIDEMVADASLLGQDGFVDAYGQEGGASLQDWEELRSVTGTDKPPVVNGGNGNGNGPIDQPAGISPVFIAAVGIAVVAVLVLGFMIYRKMQTGGGMSWDDVGL